MDNFENKISEAAEELRQSTKLLSPPPMRQPVTGPATRWIAFAAGIAAVTLVAVFLPGLLEGPVSTSPEPTPTTAVTVAPTTSATLEPTTTVTWPTAGCSATGVPQPRPAQGLPEVVAAKRQAVIAAAMACDFDQLEHLAGTPFYTSVIETGVEMFREWEARGEGRLGTLLLLFDMSWGIQEIDEPEFLDQYAWPRAFIHDRWEDIPQAELDELLTIYTEEELASIAEFGSYAGWRTGIDAEGNWKWFLAGD